jgi:hypothetical protein
MVELVHVLVEEALKQRQHVPVLEVFDRDSGGAIHTVVASILRATCSQYFKGHMPAHRPQAHRPGPMRGPS